MRSQHPTLPRNRETWDAEALYCIYKLAGKSLGTNSGALEVRGSIGFQLTTTVESLSLVSEVFLCLPHVVA